MSTFGKILEQRVKTLDPPQVDIYYEQAITFIIKEFKNIFVSYLEKL